MFEKTRVQRALYHTGGITTSGEFLEEAHAAEEEQEGFGRLDRRIARTDCNIHSL
jgi:hypothetical protein